MVRWCGHVLDAGARAGVEIGAFVQSDLLHHIERAAITKEHAEVPDAIA